MVTLKLTSSAFEDGSEIPRECGYKNGNKVPPLTISGIPEGTKSLTLIMDDPDAMEPAGKVWVHWVVWNIVGSMFHATQCTQTFPTAPIASGSYMIIDSDFVPAGIPLIVRGGVVFPFLYPHSRGISSPSAKDELASCRFPICLISYHIAVKFC